MYGIIFEDLVRIPHYSAYLQKILT